MKISFNRQAMSNAIAPIMATVSTRSTLVAVEGILFEAHSPDTLTLTTFDLEKGMRITINTTVIEEGEFIINAQKFAQTLKVMEGDEITLTIDENKIATIVSGKSSHKMIALPGSDFPAIPRLENDKCFVISQCVLKRMFQKISYAMGVNDQRPVLNGCHVRIKDENFLAVSCDSFKLAKCSTTTELENRNKNGLGLDYSFILPVKTVNELIRTLSEDEEDTVMINMSKRNMIFYFGETIFFSRLIEGDYIDYDRIIVKNHKTFATIGRERMIAALERAALITEERIAGSVRAHVRLEFSQGLVKIIAQSAAGSTYDELMIDYDGPDMVIAFNNRYLIDSLRSCSGDEIKFEMSTPLTSINVIPVEAEEGESEIFMLLPVRMKD